MEASGRSDPFLSTVQDRNAGQAITALALSTKQDLTAYATSKGEVNVFNNDWMKVAHYKALSFLTGELVSSMAWRPDGRALAIAYSTGKILIKNVETHESIAELDIGDKIAWLDWSPAFWTPKDMEELKAKRSLNDQTEKYLQDIAMPKPQNQAGESTSKERESYCLQLQMRNQRTLNVLSVITGSHTVHLYAFGFLPVALITLQEGLEHKITNICEYRMDKKFDTFVVVVKDDANSCWELVYDISIIRQHFEEIEILAKHSDYLWSYRKAIESYFKRLSTVKDECGQELEQRIRLLLNEFAGEYEAAKTIRPELGAEETPAHFLLAALMEQLVLGIIHPSLQLFFENMTYVQELLKYETAMDQSQKSFRADIMLPFRRAVECCMVSLTILGRWIANEDRFAAIGALRSNFDQVLQDCGSFMLKMFELQYMAETESKRCLTAVQWLISQSEVINHDSVPGVRKLSEEDLDDVVSVLQDLFGSLPSPPSCIEKAEEPVEWKMRSFGTEAYFHETDLPEVLDLRRSDFQPYYEMWRKGRQTAGEEGVRPFLGEDSLVLHHPPPPALFVHRPKKSARQELTRFIHSLESAFSSVTAAISQEIALVRRCELVQNVPSAARIAVSVHPVTGSTPMEDDDGTGGNGSGNPYSLALAVQIVCSELLSDVVTVFRHSLHDSSGDTEKILGIRLGTVVSSTGPILEPVVCGYSRMRTVDVFLVRNRRDGDVHVFPCTKLDQRVSSGEMVLNLPDPDIGYSSINLASGLDMFSVNALGIMLAVVSNDSRLRIFSLSEESLVEIMDDTDIIAQELRPDLNTMAA